MATIALYSKTYWDVLVEVPLASLAAGKGKSDVPFATVLGGFANNAARTLGARDRLRVITVAAACDRARIEARLPRSVVLELMPAPGDDTAPVPVTVVINPASDCRILRDPRASEDPAWSAAAISQASFAADLHIFGRLPEAFVGDAARRIRKAGSGVLAWCGGSALALEREIDFDALCVNRREAGELLGQSDPEPAEAARQLAARARVPNAVRLVTGRGGAATAVALAHGGVIDLYEVAPAAVAPENIRRLLGVGDAFAATFLRALYLENTADPIAARIAPALDLARAAASRHLTATDEEIFGV